MHMALHGLVPIALAIFTCLSCIWVPFKRADGTHLEWRACYVCGLPGHMGMGTEVNPSNSIQMPWTNGLMLPLLYFLSSRLSLTSPGRPYALQHKALTTILSCVACLLSLACLACMPDRHCWRRDGVGMASEATKEGPRYQGGGVNLSSNLLPSLPVFSPGLSATVSLNNQWAVSVIVALQIASARGYRPALRVWVKLPSRGSYSNEGRRERATPQVLRLSGPTVATDDHAFLTRDSNKQ